MGLLGQSPSWEADKFFSLFSPDSITGILLQGYSGAQVLTRESRWVAQLQTAGSANSKASTARGPSLGPVLIEALQGSYREEGMTTVGEQAAELAGTHSDSQASPKEEHECPRNCVFWSDFTSKVTPYGHSDDLDPNTKGHSGSALKPSPEPWAGMGRQGQGAVSN